MKKRPNALIEIVLLILIFITSFYAYKNNIKVNHVKGIRIPETQQ